MYRRNKLCAGARERLESEESAFLSGMRKRACYRAYEQVTYNTYKVTMKKYDVVYIISRRIRIKNSKFEIYL